MKSINDKIAAGEYDVEDTVPKALRRAADQAKRGVFKRDLLEELGLWKHPKADEIFRFAWDEWHSYGYSEIAEGLAGMAHLFK